MAIPTVVQELILEAWEGVCPRLLKDPDELAARLARRRLGPPATRDPGPAVAAVLPGDSGGRRADQPLLVRDHARARDGPGRPAPPV
jgi:hypothetical protein